MSLQITNEDGKTVADLQAEMDALNAEFLALMQAGAKEGENVLLAVVSRLMPDMQRLAHNHHELAAHQKQLEDLESRYIKAQQAKLAEAAVKDVLQKINNLKRRAESYLDEQHQAAAFAESAAIRSRQNGLPNEVIEAIVSTYSG